MNKLWVRMQHQSIMTDPAKIEKERSDIKLLVGTNLSRLSQLEGVDCSIYTSVDHPFYFFLPFFSYINDEF